MADAPLLPFVVDRTKATTDDERVTAGAAVRAAWASLWPIWPITEKEQQTLAALGLAQGIHTQPEITQMMEDFSSDLPLWSAVVGGHFASIATSLSSKSTFLQKNPWGTSKILDPIALAAELQGTAEEYVAAQNAHDKAANSAGAADCLTRHDWVYCAGHYPPPATRKVETTVFAPLGGESSRPPLAHPFPLSTDYPAKTTPPPSDAGAQGQVRWGLVTLTILATGGLVTGGYVLWKRHKVGGAR